MLIMNCQSPLKALDRSRAVSNSMGGTRSAHCMQLVCWRTGFVARMLQMGGGQH